MFKEFNIVFCTIAICLVKDIVMTPIAPSNGQPISQWSGQINGFDSNQTHYMPGYGMGNGGNGNGGSGNGSNGSGGNGSNGSGGNGSNGSGGNGSNGSGGNGMGNGITNGWSNGWNSGSNNGSGTNGGNGWNNGGIPSNAMADDWSNGLGGMSSWSNSSNMSFGSMQNQANGYPGAGYPASYYQQYSNQSFVMPTPANVQDFQNTTAPNGAADQMNFGNMGNNYNPSAFQFQGCMPQSDVSTMSPATEAGSTTIPTTQGSTDTTETTQNSDGTSTVASTRKRNKH